MPISQLFFSGRPAACSSPQVQVMGGHDLGERGGHCPPVALATDLSYHNKQTNKATKTTLNTQLKLCYFQKRMNCWGEVT